MIAGGGYGFGRSLGAHGYGPGIGFSGRRNHGGGWPHFHHHRRKKSLKKLKQEFFVLPYTLLEEKKEQVNQDLLVLADRLKQVLADFINQPSLLPTIEMLKAEIEYNKLILQAIAYNEIRKEKIAKSNKEKDIAMIAFMLMDDDE